MRPWAHLLSCWLILNQILWTQASLSLHHNWRQEEEEEEDRRGEREVRAYVLPVLPEKLDRIKFSNMTVGQARAYLSQILGRPLIIGLVDLARGRLLILLQSC